MGVTGWALVGRGVGAMKYLFLILLTGIASQYGPHRMDSVIALRQIQGRTAYTITQDLSRYDGFMAMESCSELGNEYHVKPVTADSWELFLVVDCSGHTETSAWMRRNNIVIEVDHETAVRWETVGRGIAVRVARRHIIKSVLLEAEQ